VQDTEEAKETEKKITKRAKVDQPEEKKRKRGTKIEEETEEVEAVTAKKETKKVAPKEKKESTLAKVARTSAALSPVKVNINTASTTQANALPSKKKAFFSRCSSYG